MKQRKSLLDGIDRGALEEKIRLYFVEESFANKILSNSMELFFFIPTAYNLFMNNPQEFRAFYSKKFKREANALEELSDKEKYGVLLVKARQLHNENFNDDFLFNEYKEMANMNFPVKGKGTKGPHWGKFYSDENDC